MFPVNKKGTVPLEKSSSVAVIKRELQEQEGCGLRWVAKLSFCLSQDKDIPRADRGKNEVR